MKGSNVNAMLFLSAPADGITLLRQMKDQQLKLRYIHGLAAFWPTELVKTLGNGGDYVIHDGFWGEVNLNAEELKDIGPMVRERIEQEEAILRDWLEEQKGGTT
jgi:ABC-type branched-subunit amino acid transport system substrate-binding protein